jgi:hypothetical protein
MPASRVLGREACLEELSAHGITDAAEEEAAVLFSSGGTSSSGRYRCSEIGPWSKAQDLPRQGHAYLDGDGDGEACESLK